MAPPAVFISYRHLETLNEANRLRDFLSARWGSDVVFKDTSSIRGGTRYRYVIRAALSSCSVLVALVGPKWSDILKTQRAESDDWVREELAYAFKYGITVIPVLVAHGSLPTKNELPVSIAMLLEIQSLPLSENSFTLDAEQLAHTIEQTLLEQYDNAWLRWRRFAARVLLHSSLRPVLLFAIAAVIAAIVWVAVRHYVLR